MQEKKKEEKMVTIEFFNNESPGVSIHFCFGDTKNWNRYRIMHGAKVTLPEAVVRHLESCSTPLYKYRPDGTGSMGKRLVGNTPRFSCRRV